MVINSSWWGSGQGTEKEFLGLQVTMKATRQYFKSNACAYQAPCLSKEIPLEYNISFKILKARNTKWRLLLRLKQFFNWIRFLYGSYVRF